MELTICKQSYFYKWLARRGLRPVKCQYFEQQTAYDQEGNALQGHMCLFEIRDKIIDYLFCGHKNTICYYGYQPKENVLSLTGAISNPKWEGRLPDISVWARVKYAVTLLWKKY